MIDKSVQHFWDTASTLVNKYEYSIQSEIGYLEIKANGVIYRSMFKDRNIHWICWEPFEILSHFSCLDDPCATIHWVNKPE